MTCLKFEQRESSIFVGTTSFSSFEYSSSFLRIHERVCVSGVGSFAHSQTLILTNAIFLRTDERMNHNLRQGTNNLHNFIISPKLKKTGQRNMTVYVLNPPQRSKDIIQALKTNSSVSGACKKKNKDKYNSNAF